MVLENVKVKEGEAVGVCEVDGVESYPCGRTHIMGTADLGEVRVRRISRQKGVSKVSYGAKMVGAGEGGEARCTQGKRDSNRVFDIQLQIVVRSSNLYRPGEWGIFMFPYRKEIGFGNGPESIN